MLCTLCHQARREDDPGRTEFRVGLGMVDACRSCRGEVDPRYPQGQEARYPRFGDRRVNPCGWCRKALRQDDPGAAVRLYPHEVGPEAPHGALVVCRDCLDEIMPVVAHRLGLPEGARAHGAMLL